MANNFAILIGINDYSSIGVRSLHGAVNDVDDVENWLEKESLLNWNISRLTTNGNDRRPNYANIRRELKEVGEKSAPGDFIFILYSGHGSQRKSKLESRRKDRVMDEILLFEKGYMRDFELGAILDGLAEERTVFLLLDCCFSAGQDRDEADPEDDIGCRMTTQKLENLEEHEIDRRLLKRVNEASQSWWDRPRNYTLLAACGRTQKARETTGKNGHPNGVLTDFTLEALEALYTTDSSFTYQVLFHMVRININHKLEEEKKPEERRQVPELLGQCSRLLFRSNTIPPEKFAFIVGIRNREVQINVGAAHGVTVGARYMIPPHKFDATHRLGKHVTVTVSQVGGLFSLADISRNLKSDRISDRIRRGYLARPESPRPCHTASISIQDADSGNFARPSSLHRLEEIFRCSACHCEKSCACLQKRKTPHNNSPPALRILLQEGLYHIRDGHSGEGFPHIKPLGADQTGVEETLHEVVHALEGLWKFKNLSNSKSLINDWFSFTTVDGNQSIDVKHGKQFTFEFENLSRHQLYFSVLNLLPSGEIKQLCPRQGLGSENAAPGDKIKRDVRVTMPDDMPGIRRVSEVYKVIVATRPSSFGMYQTRRFLENDVYQEYRKEVNRGDLIEPDEYVFRMEPGNWQTRDIVVNVLANKKKPS